MKYVYTCMHEICMNTRVIVSRDYNISAIVLQNNSRRIVTIHDYFCYNLTRLWANFDVKGLIEQIIYSKKICRYGKELCVGEKETGISTPEIVIHAIKFRAQNFVGDEKISLHSSQAAATRAKL